MVASTGAIIHDVIENEKSDEKKIYLLGLPREILIKIIEKDCISLRDRMNLRLACKVMESLVAESDFNAACAPSLREPGELLIRQYENYDRSTTAYTWKTQVIGLLNGPPISEMGIPEFRVDAYSHLVGRLFRRVYFDKVVLKDLTYVKNITQEGRMDVNKLLPDFIACDTLEIHVKLKDFDPRMFEIIDRLRPHTKLHLDILWERTRGDHGNPPPVVIDQENLLNLPQFPVLWVRVHPSVLTLSDATILTLISKHRCVEIIQGPIIIDPYTFIKALKIIADNDHFLSLNLHVGLLVECVRLIGVGWSERRLIAMDPSVEVTATQIGSRRVPVFNYSIKVNRTTITIDGVFADTDDQNATVQIGRPERKM